MTRRILSISLMTMVGVYRLDFPKPYQTMNCKKLNSDEPVKFEDFSMTEKSYRKQYHLEGYHLVSKTVTYVYGAKPAEKYLSAIQ